MLVSWEVLESIGAAVAVSVFDLRTTLVSSGGAVGGVEVNVKAGAGIALVMTSSTDEQADKKIVVAASAAIHLGLRISKYPRQLIFRVDL